MMTFHSDVNVYQRGCAVIETFDSEDMGQVNNIMTKEINIDKPALSGYLRCQGFDS
jgi:hypothetical protein